MPSPEKEKLLAIQEKRFIIAASEGDLQQIQAFLADPATKKSMLTAKGGWRDDKETALMRAAQNAHEGVVKLLLKEADSLNDEGATKKEMLTAKDNDGQTALMMAAKGRHSEIVSILLEAADLLTDEGATKKEMLTAEGRYGKTALMQAAEGRHEDVVKLLLNAADEDTKRKMLKATNKSIGYTALRQAAWEGNTDVVKLLLKEAISLRFNYNDEAEEIMREMDVKRALIRNNFLTKVESQGIFALKQILDLVSDGIKSDTDIQSFVETVEKYENARVTHTNMVVQLVLCTNTNKGTKLPSDLVPVVKQFISPPGNLKKDVFCKYVLDYQNHVAITKTEELVGKELLRKEQLGRYNISGEERKYRKAAEEERAEAQKVIGRQIINEPEIRERIESGEKGAFRTIKKWKDKEAILIKMLEKSEALTEEINAAVDAKNAAIAAMIAELKADVDAKNAAVKAQIAASQGQGGLVDASIGAAEGAAPAPEAVDHVGPVAGTSAQHMGAGGAEFKDAENAALQINGGSEVANPVPSAPSLSPAAGAQEGAGDAAPPPEAVAHVGPTQPMGQGTYDAAGLEDAT